MTTGEWDQLANVLLPSGQEFLPFLARRGRHCLIPMANARVRLGGMTLYPAFRQSAKAYRSGLTAWVGLGAPRRPRYVVQGASDGWALGDALHSRLPTLWTAAALCIGDEYAILRLMDRAGRVLAYAKYAAGSQRELRIANEAQLLDRLPTGVAPRLIHFTPFGGGNLLVQSPAPGHPYIPRLRPYPDQVRFLERLEQPGNSWAASEHPFVQRLYSEALVPRAAIDTAVRQLEGITWPLAWMHGDFNFTNMHCARGVCFPFDWAYATEAGFPYLDAALWMFSVAATFDHKDPVSARAVLPETLQRSLPGRLTAFAAGLVRLAALARLAILRGDHRGSGEDRWISAFLQL